jgi:hypothetical protein
MKLRLAVTKDGMSFYTGAYDVADVASFGKACADACSKLIEERLRKDSSIGALMEHLESGFPDQLDGTHISVERVS